MDRRGHYLISIFVQLLSISDAPRTHKVSLLLHVHVHEIECLLYVHFLFSYLPAHVIIITVVIILLPE